MLPMGRYLFDQTNRRELAAQFNQTVAWNYSGYQRARCRCKFYDKESIKSEIEGYGAEKDQNFFVNKLDD